MIRPTPRPTLTDQLFPYTTLCRSRRGTAAPEGSVRRGRLPVDGGVNVTRTSPVRHRGGVTTFRTLLRSSAGELGRFGCRARGCGCWPRSEEHTSELQSLMRISYAVFCLKKNKTDIQTE